MAAAAVARFTFRWCQRLGQSSVNCRANWSCVIRPFIVQGSRNTTTEVSPPRGGEGLWWWRRLWLCRHCCSNFWWWRWYGCCTRGNPEWPIIMVGARFPPWWQCGSFGSHRRCCSFCRSFGSHRRCGLAAGRGRPFLKWGRNVLVSKSNGCWPKPQNFQFRGDG